MKAPVVSVWIKKLFWGLTCLLCILTLASTVFAIKASDIVQPLKNNLATYEDALKELNRQIKMRLASFDADEQKLEQARITLEAEALCAREQNKAVEKADDLAVLAGWQLVTDIDDTIFIPGFGRITMKELLAARDKHRKDHASMETELESGTKDFLIAGFGMMNKKAIDDGVAAINNKRAAVEKTINDGSIRIYISGLGFASKTELETAITSQKEAIDTVSKQIAAGEYIVFIPGLGDVSKKQLTAEITALKEQIKALQQSFKAGKVRINRTPEGWFTEQDLSEKDKKLKTDADELKSKIKNNEYKHLLPIGWITLKDLDARIDQVQKEVEAIEKQVADKQYKIALSDGTWATEKDIDKALMNSLLSMDIKTSLEKGRKSIALASNYEIKQKETELAKLKKWKADFKNHYQPLVDSYTQQRKDNALLKKEFSIEQSAALAPLQQQLSFLQKSLRQLP